MIGDERREKQTAIRIQHQRFYTNGDDEVKKMCKDEDIGKKFVFVRCLLVKLGAPCIFSHHISICSLQDHVTLVIKIQNA